MKVLILAQYFPPDMGGGSTRVSNMVSGLLRKNCDVTVVAGFPHYPHGNVPKRYNRKAMMSERFGAAKLYRVWIPSLPHSSSVNRIILHFCFAISSLFALPFVGDVDVVWGANPNLFSFFPSLVYGVVKHAPIVQNVDDLWPEVFYELGYVKSKIAREALDFMAWLSYTVPAAIIPISDGYKQVIIRKYGISPNKIRVIEVGFDSTKPCNTKNNIKTDFVVMYSGILGLGYDFSVVFEGARYLNETDNIIIIIRGIGEMAAKLRSDIAKANSTNVVLDTRFLSHDELYDLLDSADVFLLPMADLNFVDLGLPAKVFEYQAFGKPIICVSKGEVARYIDLTKSGLIVKPRDAKSLAEAIIRLYKDRELAGTLGINGKMYVSKNMTAERIGERFFELLQSVSSHNTT